MTTLDLKPRRRALKSLQRIGELRPLFTYFGSKYRNAPKYPAPEHGRIVEPFAGSACYALRYAHLPVTLCDLDERIVGTWDFLIKASRQDILALPIPEHGDKVSDLVHLSQEARWFLSYWAARGSTGRDSFNSYAVVSWHARARERVAHDAQKIKHWRVYCSSYVAVTDERATWFVDPPYEAAHTKEYRHSEIDYTALAAWCRSRSGLTIVCESADSAPWLPFVRLCTARSAHGTKSTEVVYVGRT